MSDLDTGPTKVQVNIPILFQHTANTNNWYYANKNWGLYANRTPAYSQYWVWIQCQHNCSWESQHKTSILPMSNLDTMPTKTQVIMPIPFQHTANTDNWHYGNINQVHWAITTPAYSQWQIWTQYSHKFRCQQKNSVYANTNPAYSQCQIWTQKLKTHKNSVHYYSDKIKLQFSTKPKENKALNCLV